MKLIYYGSYLGVICEGCYAALTANWFIVWTCVGALVVMFLTYGLPIYFLRREVKAIRRQLDDTEKR